MDKNLGERIKWARYKAGLSQGELSQRLGIAYPTLSKYEQNHRIPDAKLLDKIVEELACDPAWLLTGKETSSVHLHVQKDSSFDNEPESPDEKKYCGLLRRILKSKNRRNVEGVKASIEAFAESEDRDFLIKVQRKKKAASVE